MTGLADATIPTAVIGSLATVVAGVLAFLGAWATLRSARRIREDESSVDQRALDQASFKAFTDRYDEERREQTARVRRAEEEAARTMDALRKLWDHVLELRAVMREHDITPPAAPRLPLFPWEGWGGDRSNGHG